ncbi:MAG: diguanylate cyclase [Candidatus Woesearchaeota archaeon]
MNLKFKVLLIEDNDSDASLIKSMLKEHENIDFHIDRIKCIQETINIINYKSYDIILYDIGLLESNKFELYKKINEENIIQSPLILLTDMEEDNLAIEALRSGAQDYLVKRQISAKSLIQSIKYAIERNKLIKEVKENSLLDELTALYNRRGFYNLAEQQLKRAIRLKNDFLVFYADIDRLKRINDLYGHLEGDKVIKDVSLILKDTFRQSDIISRVGGDEFVILALDTSEKSIEIIRKRMESNLIKYNKENNRPYNIFISLGVSVFSSENPSSIEDLIIKADKRMYQIKLTNKKEKNTYILTQKD